MNSLLKQIYRQQDKLQDKMLLDDYDIISVLETDLWEPLAESLIESLSYTIAVTQ